METIRKRNDANDAEINLECLKENVTQYNCKAKFWQNTNKMTPSV